jgi:hypothetical protein
LGLILRAEFSAFVCSVPVCSEPTASPRTSLYHTCCTSNNPGKSSSVRHGTCSTAAGLVATLGLILRDEFQHLRAACLFASHLLHCHATGSATQVAFERFYTSDWVCSTVAGLIATFKLIPQAGNIQYLHAGCLNAAHSALPCTRLHHTCCTSNNPGKSSPVRHGTCSTAAGLVATLGLILRAEFSAFVCSMPICVASTSLPRNRLRDTGCLRTILHK